MTRVPRAAAVALLQFVLITMIIHGVLRGHGVDPVYELLGKNPTAEEIVALRESLPAREGFLPSYLDYVRSLVTLDLGHSWITGQSVKSLLGSTLAISASLVLPALMIGHLVSLLLAAFAAARTGGAVDKALRVISAGLFSTSVLILIMVLQWLLASPDALALLPTRGWSASSLGDYLTYIALPSVVLVALVIAVSLRFYRTLLVEQMAQPYAVFALRLGVGAYRVVLFHTLPNIAGVILARVAYTLPPAIFGGAFVVEAYFGIPGMGQASYDALLTGDAPVAGAILGLVALAIVLLQSVVGWSHRHSRPEVVP